MSNPIGWDKFFERKEFVLGFKMKTWEFFQIWSGAYVAPLYMPSLVGFNAKKFLLQVWDDRRQACFQSCVIVAEKKPQGVIL